MADSGQIVVRTVIQQQNWFTHAEAAAYCRISPRTLRRWRTFGRVKSYGGKYFRTDLDNAVRNFETFKREHPNDPIPPKDDFFEQTRPATFGARVTTCRHGVYVIGDDRVSRCTECSDPYPHTTVGPPEGCTCRYVPDYSTPDAPSLDVEPDPGCPVHSHNQLPPEVTSRLASLPDVEGTLSGTFSTFKSAVPDCPFFLGTGKCETGCRGPEGPACWEPAGD